MFDYMIIIIDGDTHTGKTILAQRLLEKYHYPYLSIDHLKMGLIRSGLCPFSPEDDDALAVYLWPIVREMIRTCLENEQNLIVEGSYIPLKWYSDFSPLELESIRYACLIFSDEYLLNNFDDIVRYENVIERRQEPSDLNWESVRKANALKLYGCLHSGQSFILIDDKYEVSLDQFD